MATTNETKAPAVRGAHLTVSCWRRRENAYNTLEIEGIGWPNQVALVNCDAGGVVGDEWTLLLAAAPDLYEALCEATETLKSAVAANVDVPGFDAEEHVTVRRCRAALAKAEGK